MRELESGTLCAAVIYLPRLGHADWAVTKNRYFMGFELDIVVERQGRIIDVEIDGPHHLVPAQRAIDARRDSVLRSLGLGVLRRTARWTPPTRRVVLTNSHNSIPSERVFSIVNDISNDDQHNARLPTIYI